MSALPSMSADADILASHDTPETGIAAADWNAVEDDLGRDGFAVLPSLLTPAQCDEIAGVCSDWLSAGRRCEGPFGKADRAIAFGIINIWIAVQGALPPPAIILMPILAALAGLTLVNRIRFAAYQCKEISR